MSVGLNNLRIDLSHMSHEDGIVQDQEISSLFDKRTLVEKVYDFGFANMRGLGFTLAQGYHAVFGERYPTVNDSLSWKKESAGLIFPIHGLQATAAVWASYRAELGKESNIDYVPIQVPFSGNCALKLSAPPMLDIVLDYIAKHPGKPIYIVTHSNGTRNGAWIETQLRRLAPTTPVKVVMISGIMNGSKIMGLLQKVKMAYCCCFNQKLAEELSPGSKTAKNLLKAVRAPLAEGVAEREYDCYATTEDMLHVPNTSSSFPMTGQKQRNFLLQGYGHSSLIAALAKNIMADGKAWIQKFS